MTGGSDMTPCESESGLVLYLFSVYWGWRNKDTHVKAQCKAVPSATLWLDHTFSDLEAYIAPICQTVSHMYTHCHN